MPLVITSNSNNQPQDGLYTITNVTNFDITLDFLEDSSSIFNTE